MTIPQIAALDADVARGRHRQQPAAAYRGVGQRRPRTVGVNAERPMVLTTVASIRC
jgi:hypothetical protein